MGFVAGAGAVISINEQEKRADRVESAQKEARTVESAERSNQARKARREQVRESRLRQAEVENLSATSGQTGSSAAIATGSALQTQLGTNIGSINEALSFGEAKSQAEQNIFDANRKSFLELGTDLGLSIFGASQ